MRVLASWFLMTRGRDYAPMFCIADHVLELDRCVIDVELFPQTRLDPAQNGLAL